jgi:release factor glutamine methyltransferase
MVYPKKVFFEDYFFLIGENVYEPSEDTYLIAEKISVTTTDVVLDMGTGCGILAIITAKKVKKVVAVDINPHAIKFATKNAEINCIEKKIEFRLGDLFSSIKQGERFSLILFNAPYLPSEVNEEKSWIGKAWAGGPNGREVIDNFIEKVPHFLSSNGKILLVQSSLSDINKTLDMFNRLNLKAKIIAQLKFPFEKIVLIEAIQIV